MLLFIVFEDTFECRLQYETEEGKYIQFLHKEEN